MTEKTAAMRIDQRAGVGTEPMRAEAEAALAALGVCVDRVSSVAGGVEVRLRVGVCVTVWHGWGSSPYQCEVSEWRGGLHFVGTPCRTPGAAVRQAMSAVRKWARAERCRLDAYSRGLVENVGIKPRKTKTKAEETPTP